VIALDKQLRNQLARTILDARTTAEAAARKALHTLGVDEADAPGHLDTAHRDLRRKLRAQAKQLGDTADNKGRYHVKHLAEKIAYDQWHRMLFARFLAENDLLFSPQHDTGVSLQDCQELAAEMKLRDGWEVAAQFTAKMLPEIFRDDDPAGKIEFAPEDRAALREMVTGFASDTFRADDSLGWVYQFWQAQRKDEVNASGDKIGADEIAPVTQLFTEDYMVLFLLHNTLGAWWAARQKSGVKSQKSEEECRQAVALLGVNWEYLRFIKDEKTGEWRPAAGDFADWPRTAKELRLLDPCMGSGHFVAAELPILVAMRVAEEGLSVADAVDAVLRDNLFGLELDPRCTQIAAFNLALAAWKLTGQYRQLPSLNLACCGLGINARQEDWLKLAGRDTKLRGGMEQLYDLFQKAPDLGSLINPRRIGDLLVAEFHELQPLLEQALAREETKRDETLAEMGVTARGLAHAAEILASQFTLAMTNVPYLAGDKQSNTLSEFCERHFPISKRNLAYVFIERMIALLAPNGTVAAVCPQNWLFQPGYPGLRKVFIETNVWNSVVRLGTKAFQTPMWDLNVMLFIASRTAPTSLSQIHSINAEGLRSAEEKADCLQSLQIKVSNQLKQLTNPDHIILEELRDQTDLALGKVASTAQGLVTGDDNKFVRRFWEFRIVTVDWRWLHLAPRDTVLCAGRVAVVWWQGGQGDLHRRSAAHNFPPPDLLGRPGIAIQRMSLNATLYDGDTFGDHVAPLIPDDPNLVLPLWCFCESPAFTEELRRVDSSLKAAVGSFLKVPFDLAHWQKVATEKYPHGLPKPHSYEPTQWLFNGHPKGSTSPLQVAVARLLGYRWPRQTGSSFPDCPGLKPDGLEKFADEDGIVCLNAIKGEQPAAERLRALLAAAFGREWSAAQQAELLAQADYAGATLEDWLRNGFFEQHCQMFHQRPFIWQVWDGLRDGFSALVNYHQLDHPTLEKLTYTYLGDWIARQKAAVAAGEEGSDAKLAAAQELKAALEKILEGESPYDIFVRWKPLEKQPVGWNPDLNDGVRLNIRPFVEAHILRKNPKVNWNKDRGKDVASAPWFPKFKGERINDYHLTLAEKQKARR
jgi:predicted nucleic acid-binding protein